MFGPTRIYAGSGWVEVYKDRAGGWRWRKISRTGKITADSGQSYSRRRSAVHAARREFNL
jgi:uncharacterized protein YegP (UPF0339 family)